MTQYLSEPTVPIQFSLRTFLAAVVVIAGCCAVGRASPILLKDVIVVLTIGVLFGSVVGAILFNGSNRHLAIGFALCSWAYVLLAFEPIEAWLTDSLPTEPAIARLEAAVPEQEPPKIDPFIDEATTVIACPIYNEPPAASMIAGQCLWALCAGISGALIVAKLRGQTTESTRYAT
jgi:hypothetical protein